MEQKWRGESEMTRADRELYRPSDFHVKHRSKGNNLFQLYMTWPRKILTRSYIEICTSSVGQVKQKKKYVYKGKMFAQYIFAQCLFDQCINISP